MRKLLIPGILFILLLQTSGCGSIKEARKVVTFWAMGSEGENVGGLIKEFESENPGIIVDLQIIPWGSAHDKLLTAYAGDATPDVCQLGNTWIPELQAMKALYPLDSLISTSQVVKSDNYFSGIWETNRIGGKVYGIPWYVETRVLFYRKDLLAAAGMNHPPRNWNELLKAAKLLTEYSTKLNGRKSYGIYLPVNPGLEWVEIFFVWQNGGTILKDDDCYSNVTSPEDIEAFKFYLKFFQLGYAPKEVNATTNLYQAFGTGYIGMFISGPWNIYELRNRIGYLSGGWAVAPLPINKNRDANAGGSSLVIFRNSRVKEESWKLIEFLSRPDIQRKFYYSTSDLPAVKNAWYQKSNTADSSLLDNPMISVFYTQLESSRPFPRIPEWEQVTDKMGQWIETAVFERSALPGAVQEMNKDINRVLEKRRWLKHTFKNGN
ncbi:MAG: sugar ABC transporter substrate-binding protein [Candidatus Kryptoniota bacterium]